MTPDRRDAVLRALWPGGAASGASVWAVLDGARDPQIYLALLESRLDFRCLYSGRLPRLLEMNAPHLVELLPGHRLTERLLGDGWGRSWGVFLRVVDPSNLRHHLRKFLVVQDEGGRRLVFRWYDPRVLRAYLPTCNGDDLQTVFGPVTSYLAEDSDGSDLLDFTFEHGRLRQRRVFEAHAAA